MDCQIVLQGKGNRDYQWLSGPKVDVLRDERIQLDQDWLHEYQLEMYLMMKVLMLDGIRTTEVPVSKIYPPKEVGNTKMKPIIDWWKMLYPILLVGTGLRK